MTSTGRDSGGSSRRAGRRAARRWLTAGLLGAGLCTLPLGASVEVEQARQRSAVISIHGEINDIKRDSISRRLEEARAAKATTIIFDLDTPGGMVSSALDICRMIKNVPDEIRTVAWVNPHAYSAGAMIALSCNEIWMSRSSSIGDCAPIMVNPAGGVEEVDKVTRAKVESPILQEFRDSAARNGYNQLLARSMVVLNQEVWWLESRETGERRFVTGEEKRKLIDDVTEGEPAWKLVETYKDVITGADFPVEQPIDREDSLLTLSQSDAVAFGFARGVASDLSDLSHKLGLIGLPVIYAPSPWEKFVMWLNSPIVRGVLLAIAIIGGTIEFKAPGLILPGATALVALAIFLAAPYAAGLADIWTIVALVLGIILLAVEIFITPGFGVVGLIGMSLIVVAIIGTFVPSEPGRAPFELPSLDATWDGIKTGTTVLGASVLMAFLGLLAIARYLPRLTSNTGGLVTGAPEIGAGVVAVPLSYVAQVGDLGVVTADLRPGGQARFGDEIVEVQSQSGYIDTGRRVVVIRRNGPIIIVRPADASASHEENA